MSQHVFLDAMIQRADFAVKSEVATSSEPIGSLSVESLSPSGMLVALLRKPDFQRETNQWTPKQVLGFLESFLDNELIPSIILWKSDSFVFVIDGGHRLSALRGWIEDDYGDGALSSKFYSHELSDAQKAIAKKTRDLISEKIGTYSHLKAALVDPESYPAGVVRRARNMVTRSLQLQWVTGDSDKAESSFFKINTQGTPLDDTEELLLRNRRRSVAIAARSIVRAGTGHKYWSKFEKEIAKKIEMKAKDVHSNLFTPELNQPIKTLDLPIGGAKSPISALEMLMNVVSVANGIQGKSKRQIDEFEEDKTGELTLDVLDQTKRVVDRISGNDSGSLGLHPAVYFYSDRGRHLPDLLLGMLLLIRKKIENNNKEFFRDFILARTRLENLLISRKNIISQALQIARSKTRFERASAFFEFGIEFYSNEANFELEIDDESIVETIVPNSVSKVLSVSTKSAGEKFSEETKSQIYLRQSIHSALRCSICNGLIEPARSASYDHTTRVREGGRGDAENGSITHPYCNTAIKN